MSPYIVIKTTPAPGIAGAGFGGDSGAAVSRRAVATLEDARRVAELQCMTVLDARSSEPWTPILDQAISIPEVGGTVGPLPDGMTVRVERVSRHDLWVGAGRPKTRPGFETMLPHLIVAFNEAQRA